MKILIVDDEAPARDRLKRLIEEIEGCELAGEAATGQQALMLAEKTAPDIILLDIRMPGMDGVETAKHLAQLEQPPAVIFTTAYDEYALSAFEAQAIGYLLKPVRKEKLAATLAHATRPTKPQLTALAGLTESTPPKPRRSQLPIKLRGELRLIPLENILFFTADQKYTTVHHTAGQDLIEESLKSLEEEFTPDFIRIHRNTLVAIHHVSRIERISDEQYVVHMHNHASLQVSRRLAPDLLRRLRS